MLRRTITVVVVSLPALRREFRKGAKSSLARQTSAFVSSVNAERHGYAKRQRVRGRRCRSIKSVALLSLQSSRSIGLAGSRAEQIQIVQRLSDLLRRVSQAFALQEAHAHSSGRETLRLHLSRRFRCRPERLMSLVVLPGVQRYVLHSIQPRPSRSHRPSAREPFIHLYISRLRQDVHEK